MPSSKRTARGAAESGDVRDGAAPDELASGCVHALTAATLPFKTAVRRLVAVTLAGLRPALTWVLGVPMAGEAALLAPRA